MQDGLLSYCPENVWIFQREKAGTIGPPFQSSPETWRFRSYQNRNLDSSGGCSSEDTGGFCMGVRLSRRVRILLASPTQLSITAVGTGISEVDVMPCSEDLRQNGTLHLSGGKAG
jgi:hypothetical protein